MHYWRISIEENKRIEFHHFFQRFENKIISFWSLQWNVPLGKKVSGFQSTWVDRKHISLNFWLYNACMYETGDENNAIIVCCVCSSVIIDLAWGSNTFYFSYSHQLFPRNACRNVVLVCMPNFPKILFKACVGRKEFL